MTETITPANENTILIYEENGAVLHRFCTQAFAEEHLKHAGVGSMMFSDDKMSAELLYSVAPNLRERVEAAKQTLRTQLAIRDVMNRRGIPQDRELRAKIYGVIQELRDTVLHPVA